MSVGQKGLGKKISHLLRVLPGKNRGLTLTEISVVLLIFGILFTGLIVALNTGHLSNSISSSKADLQADVRHILDWIVKDTRQSVSWEISNNSPSSTHIKFRKVDSWDTGTDSLVLSSEYTEYDYDSTGKMLTRKTLAQDSSVLQAWEFNNITEEPFYTRDAAGEIVALNETDLRTNKRLIVIITGERQVRQGFNINLSLTEEVKIRNE